MIIPFVTKCRLNLCPEVFRVLVSQSSSPGSCQTKMSTVFLPSEGFASRRGQPAGLVQRGSWVHSSVRASPPHLNLQKKKQESCSVAPISRLILAQEVDCFGKVHQVFSSPSFRSASLRESFIGPRPENCTVMPCGRNMELDLRRSVGAGFGGLRGPW